MPYYYKLGQYITIVIFYCLTKQIGFVSLKKKFDMGLVIGQDRSSCPPDNWLRLHLSLMNHVLRTPRTPRISYKLISILVHG